MVLGRHLRGRVRHAAWETMSYVSAINALYSAGRFTKATLNRILGQSAAKQKAFVARYSKRGMKSSEVAKLKKKVKAISHTLENNTAIAVFRKRDTEVRTCAVNAMSMDNFSAITVSAIETAMAGLRYFDSATNALVTANPATGTYQRDMLVKETYVSMLCRNNYQVPCRITIYVCLPKVDTNISPLSYFTSGLTDQGNPTATSPLVHLTDSQIFNENWRIGKSISKLLSPGQEVSLSHSGKSFEYDFSQVDTHGQAFQRRYNCMAFITRVEGVIGHDSVETDEQGFLQAGVDCEINTKYVFHYDAGKDLHDIFIDDNASTFTNTGLVSSKPVSDNLGFSLA